MVVEEGPEVVVHHPVQVSSVSLRDPPCHSRSLSLYPMSRRRRHPLQQAHQRADVIVPASFMPQGTLMLVWYTVANFGQSDALTKHVYRAY